jgi:hypothetical protein
MADQIPIKVMKDGSDNTCGLAQFIAADTVGTSNGGTGLITQGICGFTQPGINAVACKSTYIGICAGKSEGVANENTYVGYGAGQSVTTGCYHTIIGSNAGDAITTCSHSTLIGYNAGTAITFGVSNTAIGSSAGAAITTANDNTLVGYAAGIVSTGNNNTGLGSCVLVLNTVGVDNVVIGSFAGKCQVASGCNNTYIGSQAGEVALCRDNTLVGAHAGTAQTSATCNTMLGGCVGYGVVGGAGNVYIGYKSGLVNTSGNDNVFIGKASGVASTASCCLIIGNGTCDIITGTFNTPSLTLDADTFVCNGKGIVIGHTSQLTVASVAAEFQYLGTGGADRTMVLGSWVASTGNANVTFIKSRNATIGSNTIVNDGDPLGSIFFYGDDGTDFNSQAASIVAFVDGTPGTGDMPGRLVFSTTADGAESTTERMRIDSAGNVGIGTTPSDWSNSTTNLTTGVDLELWGGSGSVAGLGLGATRTGDGNAVGTMYFANTDNSNAAAATGKVIAGIRGSIVTSDSNAGDDSGGTLSFHTKQEAGSFTAAMTIDSSQNVGIGTAAPNASLTIEAGVVSIKEVTTPTATANYGKVYTKTDNKLYFQDGAGTEHELAFA